MNISIRTHFTLLMYVVYTFSHSKHPPQGAVMSEECAADCAFTRCAMRNGVILHLYKRPKV